MFPVAPPPLPPHLFAFQEMIVYFKRMLIVCRDFPKGAFWCLSSRRQSEGVELQGHCALSGWNLTLGNHRHRIHHEDNGLVIR